MIWTAPSEKDTATIVCEGDSRPFTPCHAELVIPSAWAQHFIHHPAPQTAVRGSGISQRKATPQVVSKAKDNMAAHPGQLFYSMQIPVCLWFLAEGKNGAVPQSASGSSIAPNGRRKRCPTFRCRHPQILLIGARKICTLGGASHKQLSLN